MSAAAMPVIRRVLRVGLSRYLTEIRKFPLLTPDEEFMLAKRYQRI